MIFIIGGGWAPTESKPTCRTCGNETKAVVEFPRGALCVGCAKDALAQFIKASGIDPADTTLLDFLVKFGHGEMPEETSLQTFLDHLWAKIKKTSEAQPTPSSPAEVMTASWNGIVPLTRHESAPSGTPIYQDISGKQLVHPHSRTETDLYLYYEAVALEDNKVAMSHFSSQTLDAFRDHFGKELIPIRAHPRQIIEALRILGVTD